MNLQRKLLVVSNIPTYCPQRYRLPFMPHPHTSVHILCDKVYHLPSCRTGHRLQPPAGAISPLLGDIHSSLALTATGRVEGEEGIRNPLGKRSPKSPHPLPTVGSSLAGSEQLGAELKVQGHQVPSAQSC